MLLLFAPHALRVAIKRTWDRPRACSARPERRNFKPAKLNAKIVVWAHTQGNLELVSVCRPLQEPFRIRLAPLPLCPVSSAMPRPRPRLAFAIHVCRATMLRQPATPCAMSAALAVTLSMRMRPGVSIAQRAKQTSSPAAAVVSHAFPARLRRVVKVSARIARRFP